MRFQDLFTVPKGQKVTEKHLHRVLISSICSILLCMTCLVSTTWAWFTVSIENTGNVIQIDTPSVTVTVDGDAFASGGNLTAGTHTLTIEREPNTDDLNQKMQFYVSLTLQYSEDQNVRTEIYKAAITSSVSVSVTLNTEATLRMEVSWLKPENAKPLMTEGIVISAETEESTEPTEESTTEPTTEPSTEATTEPTTEQTTPPTTEPDPTETEPPETTTNPPEETQDPSMP